MYLAICRVLKKIVFLKFVPCI